MQELGDLPAEWCGVGRRQAESPGAYFGIDEIEQLAPELLALRSRCERRTWHLRGERASQGAFLLDLPHGAADPVDVISSEWTQVRLHPGQQVALRVEAVAVQEDLAQARARALRQIRDALSRGAVTAADKNEVRRQTRVRDSVRFDVTDRRVVQHRQPRE